MCVCVGACVRVCVCDGTSDIVLLMILGCLFQLFHLIESA